MTGGLLELLDAAARRDPAAPALLAPGRPPLDYGSLREEVERFAAGLRAAGLGPESRIATVLRNGPEAAASALAVAATSTCVPLNPAYGEPEFRFYLEDSRADALVVAADEDGAATVVAEALGLPVFVLALDPARPAGSTRLEARSTEPGVPETMVARTTDAMDAKRTRRPDDVALILHTSGTTARPKIVPLSQANLAASARSIARHLALGPTDRGLNVMPLFHIHGLVGSLLASIAAGASIVCTPGFDDDRFFEWLAEFEPTWYTAVPTIHQAVLARGNDYRRLAPAHRMRFVRSSSASLPPKVLHGLEALFDAPVVEAYGMTEASHQMASNPLPPARRKPGTVGIAAGAEITILDVAGSQLPPGATGEIAIRGPGVTGGYEANPQANEAAFTDGWFRTGDLGTLDEDGYLRIEGRIKEIVNRGGEKVSPREVDEALLEHAGVAQAAAFAIPHPTLGEDLAAAVVARPGVTLDETQLRGFLFGRLAEFKIPSRLLVVDAIPKGPTGKVQRTSLYKALADALDERYEPPVGELETIVAETIGEVLEIPRVGRQANFFALGGDSLKGARVVARIGERIGATLPIGDLFRHPTVAGFAAHAGALGDATELADARLLADIDAMSDEEVDRMLGELEASMPSHRTDGGEASRE